MANLQQRAIKVLLRGFLLINCLQCKKRGGGFSRTLSNGINSRAVLSDKKHRTIIPTHAPSMIIYYVRRDSVGNRNNPVGSKLVC